MARRSVVLVGPPDSGKTNYLARFWAAVNDGAGTLRAKDVPQDISYVERALECLLQGRFAPRTEFGSDRGRDSFSVEVARKDRNDMVEVVVPDVSGELWREAVESYELPAAWMRKLEDSVGALLFLRIDSEQNASALDWVTSSELLRSGTPNDERQVIPTAVQLCELFRFLELSLGTAYEGKRPRVAVLVTAWDLVNSEEAQAGPRAFLEREYPLLAGRITHSERVDATIFGVSIVGGDLDADPGFRQRYLTDEHMRGSVVTEYEGRLEKTTDLTTPVAWVLASEDGQ